MQRIKYAALAVMCLFFISSPAEAKRHHHRSGACDGIHRCICGSTQARHFGFPRMYNGHNLWEAREWGRAFPHTSLHDGVVGVKPHHVYRVVHVTGPGRAMVADERGTYERHVGGDIFVDPNGNAVTRRYGHHQRTALNQSYTNWPH